MKRPWDVIQAITPIRGPQVWVVYSGGGRQMSLFVSGCAGSHSCWLIGWWSSTTRSQQWATRTLPSMTSSSPGTSLSGPSCQVLNSMWRPTICTVLFFRKRYCSEPVLDKILLASLFYLQMNPDLSKCYLGASAHPVADIYLPGFADKTQVFESVASLACSLMWVGAGRRSAASGGDGTAGWHHDARPGGTC